MAFKDIYKYAFGEVGATIFKAADKKKSPPPAPTPPAPPDQPQVLDDPQMPATKDAHANASTYIFVVLTILLFIILIIIYV